MMIHRSVLHRLILLSILPLAAFLPVTPYEAAGAGGAEVVQISPDRSQEVVSRFDALVGPLVLPDHLMAEGAERAEGDFDVGSYFAVLDRLWMEFGYSLDYVYDYAGIGGAPVLYARPSDQPAYRNYAEYLAADAAKSREEREDFYLRHVQTDGTAESFFQLALLCIQGEQFYQFWHAAYNDDKIISSQEEARSALDELSGWVGEDASTIEALLKDVAGHDLAPVVTMDEEMVKVEVVVFTKWGGFLQRSMTVKREFPHEILAEGEEVLVEYDCGIMF
jgi:hypothetical protein